MKNVENLIIEKCTYLLKNNIVDNVLGFKFEDFSYNVEPYLFDINNIHLLCYNNFCGLNLSKTLFLLKSNKKIAILIKPCDSYSLNLLIKENQIQRDNIYVIGIECNGHLDYKKIENHINDSIININFDNEILTINGLYNIYKLNYEDYLLEKCLVCKSKDYAVFDELIILNGNKNVDKNKRFKQIETLENKSELERFEFWQKELSKCIRCNACKEVCPACYCNTCVFDNYHSGIDTKSNNNTFEEKLYHLIRAYHLAGRCTDCGECTRVCPQNIPLYLINRKIIKDINSFYGEYQSGKDINDKNPLLDFNINDKEV